MKRNGKRFGFATASLLALCIILCTAAFTGCGKKQKDGAPLSDQPIPENAVITSTPLDQIDPYNGTFTWWNSGAPTDRDNNDFSTVSNYLILHGNDHRYNVEYGVEYKLDKKYDSISFQMSPYADHAENTGGAWVSIYSNGNLRYISPLIVQKSGLVKVDIGAIDISDADYMRLKINLLDGKSCIMLSDIELHEISPFNSELDVNRVPVDSLSVFNGGFAWNIEYPKSILGDSYSNVKNYAYLHADDHKRAATRSAEYHVGKKYRTLTFDIAPSVEFSQSANTTVKVFVDDELKYTSPIINQKTEKFNIGEIDIAEAEYIKIVADVGAHGCVIMSDMIVTAK